MIAILAFFSMGASSAHAQTKKVEDRGRYYRITADYTYKGAPLRIDFGLACAARITTYRDNDTSFDVFSSPDLYGVRTSDNAAVVISTHEYCRVFQGHPMPPDFLPITVVYDDPETLAFGIMYASDEAYANPSSVLTLPKVNVARMTRAEYDGIRRTGVRNVVRNPRNDGQFGIKESVARPGKKPMIATTCRGWRRLELPPEAREMLRPYWPSDKPRFWSPDTKEAAAKLRYEIMHTRFNGWRFSNYRMTSSYAGLLRLDGGGEAPFKDDPPAKAPPYYPHRWLTNNRWDTREQRWEPENIQFDIERDNDRARGFFYCYQIDIDAPSPATKMLAWQAERGKAISALNRRATLSVDRQAVRSSDYMISSQVEDVFYENDEFMFHATVRSIASIGGEQIDDVIAHPCAAV